MQHFLFSCLQALRGDQWRRKAESAEAILQRKEKDYCQWLVESCSTAVLRNCLGVTNLIHRIRRKRRQKGLSSSTIMV